MATKVIAILNQKGGVAKTVTAINLAASLAITGYKTLIIDADPQANCSQSIGVTAFDHGTAELFETESASITAMVNKTTIENLSIIPSDLSLSQVEWQLLKNYRAAHTAILRDKLNKIKEKNHFDYCIIDCPPSLGLFSLNALIAADRVLIPVGLDPFALIGLKYLTSTVDEIRMSTNKSLRILGIVRTMWDMRVTLAKEISESMERDYPTKIFNTIIKHTVRIKESVIAQVPIVIYEPSAPAAQQYVELTKEVMHKW